MLNVFYQRTGPSGARRYQLHALRAHLRPSRTNPARRSSGFVSLSPSLLSAPPSDFIFSCGTDEVDRRQIPYQVNARGVQPHHGQMLLHAGPDHHAPARRVVGGEGASTRRAGDGERGGVAGEENWKFRLSAFREWLIAHLEANHPTCTLALSFTCTNIIENQILMYKHRLGTHPPMQHAPVLSRLDSSSNKPSPPSRTRAHAGAYPCRHHLTGRLLLELVSGGRARG